MSYDAWKQRTPDDGWSLEHPQDDRPYGLGVCSVCGLDAEEDDYNQMTRITTHRQCERRCVDCGATDRLTATDGAEERCVPCWHKRREVA